jgi:hypothetical protein
MHVRPRALLEDGVAGATHEDDDEAVSPDGFAAVQASVFANCGKLRVASGM